MTDDEMKTVQGMIASGEWEMEFVDRELSPALLSLQATAEGYRNYLIEQFGREKAERDSTWIAVNDVMARAFMVEPPSVIRFTRRPKVDG